MKQLILSAVVAYLMSTAMADGRSLNLQPGFTGAPIAAPFSFGQISVPNQDPSCDGQITISTSRMWALLHGDLTRFFFPAELTMTGSARNEFAFLGQLISPR
jgi:hypothetical protein